MKTLLIFAALYVVVGNSIVIAQDKLDKRYGELIEAFTTDPRFSNEMVDHLPTSSTIPSPLEHFGTIIGDPTVLHNTDEIYGYLRVIADASPRVRVRTIGRTEENREMIEVIVSSEGNMAQLEENRVRLNRLADPRSLNEKDAAAMIQRTTPVYYITAGLHSPETGSPEMMMELAYRLAVGESEMVRSIREHVVLIFTPVAEPDGRDRVVDIYKYAAVNDSVGPGLTYWGAYAAHDNNRDGYGLALALTRNILGSYLYWKPQVMHDLHESANYLYTSTGLGPYNEHIDPITIDEWHRLAYQEVSELTRRDMPGVWTHAFYNGWAANYLIWMANTRNSTGRFYETLGNSKPGTYERKLNKASTSREWYRPNPPLEKADWSLRNNTNYMESGVLVALKYVADHPTEFVENFYLKSRRAVDTGKSSAPYAWVIPLEQLRPVGTADLVNLLLAQGLEVHTASEELRWMEGEEEIVAVAGSYIVRLDQPYRTLAQVLMDKQNFPDGAKPPYDDTGWTLPFMHNVTALKVTDETILSAPMKQLEKPVKVAGGIHGSGTIVYAINNTTDDHLTVLRFRLSGVAFHAAESAFDAHGQLFRPGTFLIMADGNPDDVRRQLEREVTDLGLTAHALDEMPDVSTHAVEVPRVGLIHTWVSTPQDAGWWRLAFDRIGIPYTYLSEQDMAVVDLARFDVLILPRTGANSQQLVAGNSEIGNPTPWMPSDEYPSIGHIDQTTDTRSGMGYQGLAALKQFIERGGVFITEGSTSAFPIDMALTRRVSITTTSKLQARGSVVRTVVADTLSPITYGYENELPAYFNQLPVFKIDTNLGGPTTPEWYKTAAWTQEVPRVVMKFADEDINMSGMLQGDGELVKTPAVLDVPVGEGHVILFAIRPFRRWNTQGSHALVFNAMLHWNDLRTGWPERPGEDEDAGQAAGHADFGN